MGNYFLDRQQSQIWNYFQKDLFSFMRACQSKKKSFYHKGPEDKITGQKISLEGVREIFCG